MYTHTHTGTHIILACIQQWCKNVNIVRWYLLTNYLWSISELTSSYFVAGCLRQIYGWFTSSLSTPILPTTPFQTLFVTAALSMTAFHSSIIQLRCRLSHSSTASWTKGTNSILALRWTLSSGRLSWAWPRTQCGAKLFCIEPSPKHCVGPC